MSTTPISHSSATDAANMEVQMNKGQVLLLGSNATQIGLRGGGTATVGQYLNETAVPALALLDAGYDIVLATPDVDLHRFCSGQVLMLSGPLLEGHG